MIAKYGSIWNLRSQQIEKVRNYELRTSFKIKNESFLPFDRNYFGWLMLCSSLPVANARVVFLALRITTYHFCRSCKKDKWHFRWMWPVKINTISIYTEVVRNPVREGIWGLGIEAGRQLEGAGRQVSEEIPPPPCSTCGPFLAALNSETI